MITPLWEYRSAPAASIANGATLTIGPFRGFHGTLGGHIYADRVLAVEILHGANLEGPWADEDTLNTTGTAVEGGGNVLSFPLSHACLIRITNSSGIDTAVFEAYIVVKEPAL